MDNATGLILGVVGLVMAVGIPLALLLLLVRWLWRVDTMVKGIESCRALLSAILDRLPNQ